MLGILSLERMSGIRFVFVNRIMLSMSELRFFGWMLIY